MTVINICILDFVQETFWWNSVPIGKISATVRIFLTENSCLVERNMIAILHGHKYGGQILSQHYINIVLILSYIVSMTQAGQNKL